MDKLNRFYFNGTMYETENQRGEAVDRFFASILTPHGVDYLLGGFVKDVYFNLLSPLGLQRPSMTQSDLQIILEKAFEFIMNEVNKSKNDKD